jgi:hypothetical protein
MIISLKSSIFFRLITAVHRKTPNGCNEYEADGPKWRKIDLSGNLRTLTGIRNTSSMSLSNFGQVRRNFYGHPCFIYSDNEKIFFQSFFMLTIFHPPDLAAFSDALSFSA